MRKSRKRRVSTRAKRIETLVRRIYNVQASDVQPEIGGRIPRQAHGYMYYASGAAKHK